MLSNSKELKTKLDILKVFSKPIPQLVPEIYYNVLKICDVSINDSLPWESIIGKTKFKQLEEEYNDLISKHLENIGTDISYYNDIYLKNMKVFDCLQPAKINVPLFRILLEKEQNKQHLSGFVPDKHGFLSVPKYSLSETITGRMKITDGPNILLLPKELRKIFASRHGKDGRLWYLDFVSLEPRLTLLVSSSLSLIGNLPLFNFARENINNLVEPIPKDIYLAAMKKLKLSSTIDRSILKQIVLSQNYGQSKSNTIKTLQENGIYRPEEIVELVNEFFGIDRVKEYLFLKLQENHYSHIRTLYGRHICPDDSKPYKIFNYFIQSSAVDIALQGFYNILTKLESIPNSQEFITPIFVVHDALVFDVHKNFEHIIPKLSMLGGKAIPGFNNQQFYMEANLF